MKKLYAALNLPDAYLLRDLLNHAGVEVHVLNEFAQGGLGDIPFTHAYPEIWIEDERDEARALAVVKDFDDRQISTKQTLCSACGEYNPDRFEICWHCGTELKDNTRLDDTGD